MAIALFGCEGEEGFQPTPDGSVGDGGDADDGSAGNDAGQPAPVPFSVLKVSGDPTDADCDMSGLWFVRMTITSQALGAAQYANIWYYLQLQQKGEDVAVVEHFDCGIEVATVAGPVRLKPATTRALIAHNSQVGRKGQMRKSGESCEFEMERFWSVRGVDEGGGYLPADRSAEDVSIAELSSSQPLPSPEMPDGEQDWDDDGKPGITWVLPIGSRYTVQRDWQQWFSDETHPLAAAEDFTEPLELAADFDNDEVVWEADSSLLASVAVPDRTADNRATFLFLGRDGDDPRAAEALDLSDRFETCLEVQQRLPARDE